MLWLAVIFVFISCLLFLENLLVCMQSESYYTCNVLFSLAPSLSLSLSLPLSLSVSLSLSLSLSLLFYFVRVRFSPYSGSDVRKSWHALSRSSFELIEELSRQIGGEENRASQ